MHAAENFQTGLTWMRYTTILFNWFTGLMVTLEGQNHVTSWLSGLRHALDDDYNWSMWSYIHGPIEQNDTVVQTSIFRPNSNRFWRMLGITCNLH